MPTNKRVIALVACAAAVIGSFMPWVSVQTVFGSFNISGTSGDGQITIVLAILAAIFAALDKRVLAILGAVACVLGLIVSVYDVVNVNSKISDGGDGFVASVGYGLYLCVLGFGVGFVTLLFMCRRQPVEPAFTEVAPS